MWINPNGDGDLQPAIGATVRVCSPGATGSPCTPLATLYTDQFLTTVQPQNPFTTDSFGNFTICVATTTVYLETTNKGTTKVQPTYIVAPGTGGGGGGGIGIALGSLSVNPSSVLGGTTVTGTATLTGTASSGGAIVALSSSNPAVAQVPANVTIPAGSTAASFNIVTRSVTADTTATITGNFVLAQAANLTVQAPPPPPQPIYGGVGAPGATSSVSLSGNTVILSNGTVLNQLQTTPEQVGQSWSFNANNQAVYLLLFGGSHAFVDANTGFPFVFNAPLTVNLNGVTMYLYQSTNALFGPYQPKVTQ